MRLLAFSPMSTATSEEITSFIAAAQADLIVLPGYAANTPSPERLQAVLRPSVRVFIEAAGGKQQSTPMLVGRAVGQAMPKQIIARDPVASQLDQLSAVFPKRTFSIRKRSVSFVLCGEITAFNPDGTVKGNRSLPFDVLVNPAHTLMGRWRVLGPKLAKLSQDSVVVHVANNKNSNRRVSTDVRIYCNGKNVTERQTNSFGAWCEFET